MSSGPGLSDPKKGSPAYSMSGPEWADWFKKLLIGVAGVVLAYLTSVITSTDFGQFSSVITASWMLFIAWTTKFLPDTRKVATVLLLALCLCGSTAYAQTPVPVLPTLTLPDSVSGDPGAFIKVVATTNGKEVRWYSASKGLNVFPAELLKDSRSTVVTGTSPGSYTLLGYTALGDVPSDPAMTVIVINGPPAPEPTPVPDPAPAPTTNLADRVWNARTLYTGDAASLKSGAAKFATVYTNAALTATDIGSIVTSTVTATGVAFPGDSVLPWASMLDAVRDDLNQRIAAGTLATKADYVGAWNDIASGFRRIAQ